MGEFFQSLIGVVIILFFAVMFWKVTLILIILATAYLVYTSNNLKEKRVFNSYVKRKDKLRQTVKEKSRNLLRFMKTSALKDELIKKDIDFIGVKRSFDLSEQHEFYKKRKDEIENYAISSDELMFINRNLLRAKEIILNPDFDIYTKELKEFYQQRGIDLKELAESVRNKIDLYLTAYNPIRDEIFKQHAIKKSGLNGEYRVNKELELYKDLFINLPNIRLEVDGESVESDNIIICSKGVFSIEVKNYGEYSSNTIVISKDGQWKRISKRGEEVMDNVTSQLNRHIGLKQRFLNQKLKEKYGENIEYILIKPIIVIANDNINIENNSDLPIIRVSNIYHYIMSLSSELDNRYTNDINQIFESSCKQAKKYTITDYIESIRNNYAMISQQINFFNNTVENMMKYLQGLIEAGIDPKIIIPQYNNKDRIKFLFFFYRDIYKCETTSVDLKYDLEYYSKDPIEYYNEYTQLNSYGPEYNEYYNFSTDHK